MRSTLNWDLDFQQAVELPGKIDRDPRVHRPLLVEKTLFALERENSFMPDVGMDVETLASVTEKSDEILGLDIVSRKGEGAEKGVFIQGEKKLTPVRMIIGVPEQKVFRIALMGFIGLFRIHREAKGIVPGDGLVGTVEHITFPFSFKDSFGGPTLVSGIRIYLSPALMGPADDFDFLVFLFFHQTSKTLEGFIRCLEDRNLDTVQFSREFRIQ